MGMFNAQGSVNAQVRTSATYLQAGIHNVKFMGVEKGDNAAYSTLDFAFEDENGAVHNERLFEPTSNERQPNRFNNAIEDPSQAEQFMCKLMHIIAAINPEVHSKIQNGTLKFDPVSFDALVVLVKKILDSKVGTEVQIKLVPNGRYVGFPGFPARISKNGDLYLSTAFIGQDLTLSAYEKAQIDKALQAKPTDMTKRDTSELDDLDNLVDNDEPKAMDGDDDLPF